MTETGGEGQEVLSQEETARLRTALTDLVGRLELRQLTRAAQAMTAQRAVAEDGTVIICVSGCG